MGKSTRYTIHRKVADGGMAEIYLGTLHGAAGFERPIIIKRIRGAFGADPHFCTMLVDEAHIAMGLTHGNVVQVLDLGTADGHSFLVLEMVDGWDVHTLIHRGADAGLPLPENLSLHISAEVCRALSYAHSRQRDGQPMRIVHRDVSPENILVSEQGEVKLADFGIATATHKTDRTAVGVVKGKLGFMSPEQANGLALDGRTDLYALGCSLYMMCTGRKPFQGRTQLETLLRQQEGSFVPIRQFAPTLSPGVESIIVKAMEKDPAQRFQTADEMLHECERVQRTVLMPAGQTELKRWLDELFLRDHELPTSRRPPPLRKKEDVGTAVEAALKEGSALVLTDIDVVSSMIVLPTDPSAELRSATGASRPGNRILAAGLASAIALIAAAFLMPSPSDEADVVEERRALAPEEPLYTPAPDMPAPDIVNDGEPALDNGDVGGDAAIDGGAGAAGRPTGVSVRVESTPPGAAIIINGKPFGTTPMRIRFKAGLTHDVTLKKDGYLDQTKKVYVAEGRRQPIEAALQRVPPKKKWWQW